MNIETIEKAKKEYIKLLKIKYDTDETIKQLIESGYPKNKIKNYLSILEKSLSNKEDILKNAFYNVEDKYLECNIYVFMGAYRYRDNESDVLVQNYRKADYFLYQNLESKFLRVIIFANEYEQFEQENIILRFDDSINIDKKIEKLRYIYFEQYFNNSKITENIVLKKLRENL